jgi:hydrogenase expression/formation protein HypC
MCLAVPAEVVAVGGEDVLVDLNGVRLNVSAVLVPDLKVGDIALIHVGFVLAKVDPDEAARSLEALNRAALGVVR